MDATSGKLAEVAGAMAALKSDSRDGQREISEELKNASRGLRQGVEKGLGDVAAGLSQGPGVKELAELVSVLRQELTDAAAARRGSTQELVQELRKIRSELVKEPLVKTQGQGPRTL